MIRFTIYKDLDHADAIRYNYDEHYYYVDAALHPDDDDFIWYTSATDASIKFNKITLNEVLRKNTEYAVFLCAEEVDEDDEIVWSSVITCQVVYKTDKKEIVLTSLDDRQYDC